MRVAPIRHRYRINTADEVLAVIQQRVRLDDDGCPLWAGAKSGTNAPLIDWKNSRHNARRLMLALLGRPIPDGQVVWTSCGKTLCMHPDHQRVGTRRQCMRAKAKDGRVAHGPVHGLRVAAAVAHRARLPMSERFTVARMRADGATWAQIGQHYGVHLSGAARQFQRWEAIFGPYPYWTHPQDCRDAA